MSPQGSSLKKRSGIKSNWKCTWNKDILKQISYTVIYRFWTASGNWSLDCKFTYSRSTNGTGRFLTYANNSSCGSAKSLMCWNRGLPMFERWGPNIQNTLCTTYRTLGSGKSPRVIWNPKVPTDGEEPGWLRRWTSLKHNGRCVWRRSTATLSV